MAYRGLGTHCLWETVTESLPVRVLSVYHGGESLVLSCLPHFASPCFLLSGLRPRALQARTRGKCINTAPFSLHFFLPSSPRDGQCYGFSQRVQMYQ